MYLLTDRPLRQSLCSERKDETYLGHYLPQFFGQYDCGWDISMDLESL